MSLAVIGSPGEPSGPNVCPVVIQRPMSTSSGLYSAAVSMVCCSLSLSLSLSLSRYLLRRLADGLLELAGGLRRPGTEQEGAEAGSDRREDRACQEREVVAAGERRCLALSVGQQSVGPRRREARQHR